jgi:hypothetical protein
LTVLQRYHLGLLQFDDKVECLLDPRKNVTSRIINSIDS